MVLDTLAIEDSDFSHNNLLLAGCRIAAGQEFWPTAVLFLLMLPHFEFKPLALSVTSQPSICCTREKDRPEPIRNWVLCGQAIPNHLLLSHLYSEYVAARALVKDLAVLFFCPGPVGRYD